MNKISLTFSIACVLTAPTLHAQDVWARADAATVRVAPARFPQLPAAVRSDLERRGCRIPQSAESATAAPLHNVIHGAFIAPSSNDWAVLCSVRDTSRLLVYRAGATATVDSLGKSADRDFLQGIGGDLIGYSRRISVAVPASIRDYAKAFDGPAPPKSLDHAGIEDAFVGKASAISYFHQGKWLTLQGADVP